MSRPPASPTGDPADLVALMIAARDQWTPELETEMLAAIARTPLIVRTDPDPATGRQAATLSLDPTGAPVAIGFTSIEELGRWAGDTPIDAGRLSGRDLARLAVAGGATAMFIDPASDHGGGLAADRIDIIAGGDARPFDLGVQVWKPEQPTEG